MLDVHSTLYLSRHRTGSHSPLRPSAATTKGATLPSEAAHSAAATTTSAGERPGSAPVAKGGTHTAGGKSNANNKSVNESSGPVTRRTECNEPKVCL